LIRLLVGPVRSGKTSAAAAIVSLGRLEGRSIGGILCPGTLAGGARTSIFVADLSTGELARLTSPETEGGERVGDFLLETAGLDFGRRALRRALTTGPDLVVIDEVGPLELAGKGWVAETNRLIAAHRHSRHTLLLIVVRERLTDAVRAKWRLNGIASIGTKDPPRACIALLSSGDRAGQDA
jgi:nucleoside-triphosphatase THEP1